MPAIPHAELLVRCEHWINLAGPCKNNDSQSVPIEISGPAWHKAKELLRKRGWHITDKRVVCPRCASELRKAGKNPDLHHIGF